MQPPSQGLSQQVIQYCRRCSRDDGRSIVAYCAYMAFADRSLRRMEVTYVRGIAEQMGVAPEDVVRMARRVRQRRMKIKMPRSSDARRLLFHLAVRMAFADQQLERPERESINLLAGQLRISEEDVERELACARDAATNRSPMRKAVDSARPAPPIARHREPSTTRTARPSKGLFTRLLDSLSQRWVLEDLEATLYGRSSSGLASKFGEVEYTLTRDGAAELEIELDDLGLPPNQALTVVIAGQHVCDVVVSSRRFDETLRSSDQRAIPRVAVGDVAEIRCGGETLLSGQFRPG